MALLAGVCWVAAAAKLAGAAELRDTLPSDFPPTVRASSAEMDFVRREYWVPMRDGVKLYTVALLEEGVERAPILLERTPYGSDELAVRGTSQHLAQALSAVDGSYVEDGYIRIYQDVRGRNKSEGVYVLNRPLTGPLNDTGIDDATDAYDTIDWLVKNVPESNGRVGMIGGSYDGFTTLMATFSAHPALRAVVPVNPMVDTWMGDDWYHHGAFRQITLVAIPMLTTRKAGFASLPTGIEDLFAQYLESGSAGDYIRRFGLDQFPATQRLIAHPGYDSWWQAQALDKIAATLPIRTPMLLVAGMWDEQDIYGAPAVFRALHPLDHEHKVSLLLGPWAHMGVFGDGSKLGALQFDEDTAVRARREIIKPFLDGHLKEGAPPAQTPALISYATGGGGWWHPESIPDATVPVYLRAKSRLTFEKPSAGESVADEYVSDPVKPVGVTSRPFYARSDAWQTSLVADQRFASQRTDVLSYVSEPLSQPVHILGRPQASLFASTTGTDSDFVVKLIDVYPQPTVEHDMGGYQLPVSMDIFRGRYVGGFNHPAPLTPGKTDNYTFALPLADHVFAKGHRIMVQVQSTWFPVYDRNPQTYVPNIFEAKPSDYRKSTQRIFHDPRRASAVWLPIVSH